MEVFWANKLMNEKIVFDFKCVFANIEIMVTIHNLTVGDLVLCSINK